MFRFTHSISKRRKDNITFKFTIREMKTSKWYVVVNFITAQRELTPISLQYTNVINPKIYDLQENKVKYSKFE